MPTTASLEPCYLETRAEAGKAPWYISVPPHLSPTGRQQRLFFPTKKAAALDAAKLQRRQDNFGVSLTAMTPARIALASEAFNIVDPLGLDLLAVVRDGIAVHKQRVASVSFLDLFNLYVDLKQRDPEYEKALRWLRDRYPQLHTKLACNITAEELESLLRVLSPGARNPIMRYWRAVFNFGKKRKYVSENPVSQLTFASQARTEVEIINNPHVQAMLGHALEHDLERLPYLVIGYFSGVRPEGELPLLLWSDVHWTDPEPKIIVRSEVSKTRRRRFPDLSGNAVAWLEAYRLRSGSMTGPVVPFNYSQLRTHRKANWVAAGLSRWVPQGMRHTFCSNWLALHKDVNKLVLISGHDSVDTMWRHYFKGTTETDARAF